MTIITSETVKLVVQRTSERISITVNDDDFNPVDAFEGPQLTALDLGGSVVYKDQYPIFTLTGTLTVTAGQTTVTGTNTRFTEEVRAGDTLTIFGENHVVDRVQSLTRLILATPHVAGAAGVAATKPTRIVSTGSGSYYIDWGDYNAPGGPDETANTNLLTFLWQATAPGLAQESIVQNVCVASTCTLSYLSPFRDLIDKCRKAVNPDVDCFLGYTDAQLIQYLEQGLSIINTYQPYPTFQSIDNFPRMFQYVLLESSLMAGVMSQQLFAIDTDIPQYSDNGNSFVIAHAPQLAAVFNQITQRLDKAIPQMKLHLVRSGRLHIQAGPNYRLSQLLATAPGGALFRNVYFRS